MIHFICPLYNAGKNLDSLISSFRQQKNQDFDVILIDDMSTDSGETVRIANTFVNDKIELKVNNVKKFALRNIVETAREYNNSSIIAVVDGDDSLCNEYTVDILYDAYKNNSDVVWTAHKWDTNGMNISRQMPQNVDPYQYPWCSSHLRTFKKSLLNEISDKNFKDSNDQWFKRGYDQALMLPLLKLSKKRTYIDKVCYKYNINSVSIDDRNWAEHSQLSTVAFVRSRGFVK